jgi:hypothetical protein
MRMFLRVMLVSIVLTGCVGGAEEGDRATSTPVPSPHTPDAVVSASPVAVPEGTWTGQGSSLFYPVGDPVGRPPYGYSIEVTLPAACGPREPCGREELVASEGGDTCTSALMLSSISTNGALVLEESSLRGECPEGWLTLTPRGDGLQYGWWNSSGTFRQGSILQPADGTP